jgi:hypothetical protein
MTEDDMENQATRCANDKCPSNKTKTAQKNETVNVPVSGVDPFTGMKSEDVIKNNVRTTVSSDEDDDDVSNKSSQINREDTSFVVETENPATNFKQPLTVKNEVTKQLASLDLARIKTAYGCSSKLALAGIITSDEVDSYAEQMLNDGLKADSMIRQTKLLLKSAQTSTERVAAAAAEKMTKTASTLGVSTSPAFNGGFASNSAALDIQGALRGTWTMPKLED